MGEKEFLKFYMEKRGLSSTKEAKEKVDLFWKTMFTALDEEKKVKIKGWGSFVIKDVKERDIVELRTKKLTKIPAGTKLKFKAGKELLAIVNHEVAGNEVEVDE
ncbi:MAG: HU family DNA-binding protein [Fusobacterium sp.]|nr:HU family DNA-binding protein [Fusobacterium sp.]